MQQSEIFEILNRRVFDDEQKRLIETVAYSPDRFVGVFRSTTPYLKLNQSLLQSREIRFGDALEEIVTRLIASLGYIMLPKHISPDLQCDQYFAASDRSVYYLVEQKVRDDHDSTKKRGQIDNLKRKLLALRDRHDNLVAIMYFIDPSLSKNINYYRREISRLSSELGLAIHLHYNGEFFSFIDNGSVRLWNLLADSLANWRQSVPDRIDLNLDEQIESLSDQLKRIAPEAWLKLLSNDSLFSSGVMTTLFPTGRVFREMKLLWQEELDTMLGRTRLQFERLIDKSDEVMRRYYGSTG